jgi:hypothetical protein
MSTNKSKLILAKAKLALTENEEAPKKEKASKINNMLLFKALEEVSVCTLTIPDEERKIMAAVKRVEENKNEDKYWETRVKYLLDNLQVMKDSYPIFEDEAKRRKELIESVTRRNKWMEEREKCKEDSVYWFNNYAWTSDPRKEGIGWALPFVPYEFQVDCIKWMEDLMFVQKSSGLIEKSRDMGFSWVISSLLYKHWQHNRNFHALIGSMTIDDTDVVGNPSTVFEKIRIQSRMQPLGLLPKGFNGDIPYCKAVNPENGNSITGEACNANFGRGGRFSVIFFDELSAVQHDTEALTASSQSSPVKIYNSTVRGMANEYAQIRHSGSVPVKTYHWTLHPYKNQNWYEYQKLEMNSDVRVAQELDIDYAASQPNKVYTSWNEVYHVVTKSEVMRSLPSFAQKTKSGEKFQIPFGHRISMGQDVGQSADHANVMLWEVTLKQGTKTVDGIDLSGAVLWYREMIMPTGSIPKYWAKEIKTAEGLYEPRMIYGRYMSQEANTECEIYNQEYKLHFTQWTPDYNEGIPRVRDYLDVSKEHEIHPFREPTRREKYPAAKPIMGRPMMFFVVDDDQGELLYNEALDKFLVRPPKDSNGFFRTRSEFPMYHYPITELGKEIKNMRPHKRFDDAMDTVRCIATECFAPVNDLTREEKFQAHLPDNLKSANIENIPAKDRGMAVLQLQQERREYEKQLQQQAMSYRDQLWDKVRKS